MTIETERSQALIGFVKDNNKTLKHLSATVENDFCAIILTSLDAEPISGCERLLLVAAGRSANSGMTWNRERTSLSDWGNAPTVMEPVKGEVTLRDLEPSQQIEVIALDGAGRAMGDSVTVSGARREFTLTVGEQATTWYLVKIQR